MPMPKDPVMLLSYVNTQLRDNYSTLDDFCKSMDADKESLMASMASIDYEYDEVQNQFV